MQDTTHRPTEFSSASVDSEGANTRAGRPRTISCPDCGGAFEDHNAVNSVGFGDRIAHSRTGGACWKSLNTDFVAELLGYFQKQ